MGQLRKQQAIAFVCSDHFRASDYVTPPSHGVSCRLKQTSITSVFPGFPSYLQHTECRMNLRPRSKRSLQQSHHSPSKIIKIHSYCKSYRVEDEIIDSVENLSSNHTPAPDHVQDNHHKAKPNRQKRRLKPLREEFCRLDSKINNMTELIKKT